VTFRVYRVCGGCRRLGQFVAYTRAPPRAGYAARCAPYTYISPFLPSTKRLWCIILLFLPSRLLADFLLPSLCSACCRYRTSRAVDAVCCYNLYGADDLHHALLRAFCGRPADGLPRVTRLLWRDGLRCRRRGHAASLSEVVATDVAPARLRDH